VNDFSPNDVMLKKVYSYVCGHSLWDATQKKCVSVWQFVRHTHASLSGISFWLSSKDTPLSSRWQHHAQLSFTGGDINALYMGMLYSEAYLPLLAWDRITRCMSSRQHACRVFRASSVPRRDVFYGRACQHDALPARSLNLRLGVW